MRTIKFRGKRVDNGEWVYGSFAECCENDGYIGKIGEVAGRNVSFVGELVNSSTVGQSTGEKDYEGREIWESDIYSDCMGYLYQVILEKGMFCLLAIPDICNHREIVPFSNICDSELKYEGNISDNPELLEVKV